MTPAPPGGELLALGEDLPTEFPPLLARLSHPELLALLRTVDPTAALPAVHPPGRSRTS